MSMTFSLFAAPHYIRAWAASISSHVESPTRFNRRINRLEWNMGQKWLQTLQSNDSIRSRQKHIL